MADAATSRQHPERGFCDPSKLERGPNGRPLCRRCRSECPKGRRTFCSAECIHEWKIRTQPTYAADQVFLRDAGVCVTCGRDGVLLMGELRELQKAEAVEQYGERARSLETAPTHWKLPRFTARCEELGLPNVLRGLVRRLWEMDHILPVVEGGGSCGLENLRTLCWRCHRKATAALATRRARARDPQLTLALKAE